MRRRVHEEETREKVLDVDATMQGTLTFRDPVNLRINGNFEGALDTKGSLTIGENAVVKAKIKGEKIIVAGRVYGDIVADKELKLVPPAHVSGNITTPRLHIDDGAVLEGECHMTGGEKGSGASGRNLVTAEELAKYLEVDTSMVLEWANSGRLPSTKERDTFKFDRAKVDEWIANGKVK